MKFISKQVIIEAIQFNGNTSYQEAKKKWPNFKDYVGQNCDEFIEIHTLEGIMRANQEDWIIKGTEGEFYPCKDVVFKKKYVPFLVRMNNEPAKL